MTLYRAGRASARTRRKVVLERIVRRIEHYGRSLYAFFRVVQDVVYLLVLREIESRKHAVLSQRMPHCALKNVYIVLSSSKLISVLVGDMLISILAGSTLKYRKYPG